MQLTISGIPGAGKSKAAEILIKRLGSEYGLHLAHKSSGDFMRSMADERGIPFLELTALAEKDPSIDRTIDERTKKFGEEEDDFIMDTRIAWHFLPNAVKIYLDATFDTGAQRIFDQKRGYENNKTLEQTKADIVYRVNIEEKRYAKYYGISFRDHKHYDCVIDTNPIGLNEVVSKIIQCMEGRGLINKDSKHKLYKGANNPDIHPS